MWWILSAVVALVLAAIMFDKSPEVQDASEKIFGISPSVSTAPVPATPAGAISTKMGMKYVLTSEDIFVNQAGERQSPNITLTCIYGTPYLMLDPKTEVNRVDSNGVEVASLRVSIDAGTAVTAVADIDESGNLYVRGAQTAAKTLAKSTTATFYVDTLAGLQNVTFGLTPAHQALSLLASGCSPTATPN
jgi:hypothetical protein